MSLEPAVAHAAGRSSLVAQPCRAHVQSLDKCVEADQERGRNRGGCEQPLRLRRAALGRSTWSRTRGQGLALFYILDLFWAESYAGWGVEEVFMTKRAVFPCHADRPAALETIARTLRGGALADPVEDLVQLAGIRHSVPCDVGG